MKLRKLKEDISSNVNINLHTEVEEELQQEISNQINSSHTLNMELMDVGEEEITKVSKMLEKNTINNIDNNEKQLLNLGGIDFSCPVCTELLFKPVTTPCGHSFCKNCLDMSFSYKRQCPMCREKLEFSSSQVKPNVILASILEQNFTQVYKERGLEVAKQSQQLQEGRKKIVIGNTHEIVRGSSSRNSHKWKFFVMILDENENLGATSKVPTSYYIEKCDIFLHPTFSPPRIVLSGEPFEIKRIGWGVFTLRGTIHFQARFKLPPMAFEHLLSFDRNGTHRCFLIDFRLAERI